MEIYIILLGVGCECSNPDRIRDDNHVWVTMHGVPLRPHTHLAFKSLGFPALWRGFIGATDYSIKIKVSLCLCSDRVCGASSPIQKVSLNMPGNVLRPHLEYNLDTPIV